ncbi:hypothetical protein CGLO_17458 [Colletotrichum gloeosporioides Cg-14]|uniref:Uncharacterized protein n=1 Tax=Colletotrichum gloeosporioides (strain Cg-14) TaxID=1237896 RepID=T0JTM7_COLGC|nr:hypothetical protein CGLO_17458 [Colletotrichum gloeosporioides Cg-14]
MDRNPTFRQIHNPEPLPPYDFDSALLARKKESSIGEQAQTVGVPTRRKWIDLSTYDERGETLTIAVENGEYGDASEVPRHYPVPPERAHKLSSEQDSIAPHRRHLTAAGNEVLYVSEQKGSEMQFAYEHSVTAYGIARRVVPKKTTAKKGESQNLPQSDASARPTTTSAGVSARAAESPPSSASGDLSTQYVRLSLPRKRRLRNPKSNRVSKTSRTQPTTSSATESSTTQSSATESSARESETHLSIVKPVKRHPWVEIRADEVTWRGQPGQIPQNTPTFAKQVAKKVDKRAAKRAAKSGANANVKKDRKGRVVSIDEFKRIGILWRQIQQLEDWAKHEPVEWSDDDGTRQSGILAGELPPGAVKLLQQAGLYIIIYRVRHITLRDHVSPLHLKFNVKITSQTTAAELWEQNLAGVEVEVGGIRHEASMGNWNLQRIRVGWMDEARCEILDDAADVVMDDA